MRKLDTSFATDSSEMPVKRGTLKFLQDAYAEIVGGVIQALVSPSYDFNTMYVLYGVQNSVTPPIYNISAGLIFFQGELFFVDAVNFQSAGATTAIMWVTTTQYTVDADPLTFTDNVQHNVHNIRKLAVQQGLSGTGYSDFSQLHYVSFVIPAQLNLTAPDQVGGIDNAADVLGVYPNMQVFVPINNNLHPCLDAGTLNVGDVPGGGTPGVTLTVPLSAALPGGTQYYVQGTIISLGGTPHNDVQVVWGVIDSTRGLSSFQVHFAETAGVTQAIKFEWMIFKK